VLVGSLLFVFSVALELERAFVVVAQMVSIDFILVLR
jgi:hypothetical protein